MGAIADAIMAYGQPLIDQTDGSPEELEKALAMTTLSVAARRAADRRPGARSVAIRRTLPRWIAARLILQPDWQGCSKSTGRSPGQGIDRKPSCCRFHRVALTQSRGCHQPLPIRGAGRAGRHRRP